jgi:methyl-galactoside transport system substrate-binding protein
MKQKKVMAILLLAAMLGLTACGSGTKSGDPSPTANADTPAKTDAPAKTDMPNIGVAIYKFDDTFMAGVRAAITDAANGIAKVDIVDSQNSQPPQNDKVDLFITKKVNALAINPVDNTAAGDLIDIA